MDLTLTGIELIAKERAEQIEKHGYTVITDKQYESGKLAELAIWVMMDGTDAEKDNMAEYLFDEGPFPLWLKAKLLNKSIIARYIIAGALIAAEVDQQKLILGI